MKFRNLIFDFGGVICDFNRDTLIDAFCNDAEDHEKLKSAIFRDWDKLDAGETNYFAYAAATSALLPERLRPISERFFEQWPSKMPPMADTWALMARLKAEGYNVYILSNAPVIFEESIRAFPIVRLVDGIVISAPIRMSKPDKAIYAYALKKFGIRPEESLFIDDNPVNAQAAKQVGMAGYAFDKDVDALYRFIKEI